MLKVFLARDGDVVHLGQLSPPCISLVPLGEIAELHRIVEPESQDLPDREENHAAFALLAEFQKGDAIDPINNWVTELRLAASASEARLTRPPVPAVSLKADAA